jgi:ribokinase
MKPSLVVVGSSNTDMVVKTNHLPAPGETILGGNFFMNAGGKGANQAVAAQRLGGYTTLICKTGSDIFGSKSLELFKQEGINTNYIIADKINPSGVALITVDENAENCIVVAPGANGTLSPADLINATNVIYSASIILMQLEIPVETVNFVADIAKPSAAKVILNPAPACELPAALLQNIWMITPNEKEAEMLAGIAVTDYASVVEAANIIRAKGVEIVIITLGAKGAFIATAEMNELVPAPKVTAVDTTAGGDVFNGALAVALSENMPLQKAVLFACNAAALSVTKLGAQASAPYRKEVENFMAAQLKK